ncbi:uncharacterized protein LOC107368073 [Tetranychus urticae]|uniref:uncharacterized protein LOC107368073 n=1 Tax=Tetranychus urticae TaxID=32264 RepID=UPI00035587BE|nr:uncharacterized protein LOC107368073 [Tetranychus urticae]
MHETNHDSDKITIKIRHSDEDYHDITIDWSNEIFDYRKQLFHQLSAYTGIPVEHQHYVSVDRTFRHGHGLLNMEWKDGTYHESWDWVYDSKERAMNAFNDGDCFLFRTLLFAEDIGLGCRYDLQHQSLVNETGCERNYCYYLGRRSFTKRVSELLKSDELRKICDENALKYGVQPAEFLRMNLNLNIAHLTNPVCTARILAWPDSLAFRFDANYMYLRYRG